MTVRIIRFEDGEVGLMIENMVEADAGPVFKAVTEALTRAGYSPLPETE